MPTDPLSRRLTWPHRQSLQAQLAHVLAGLQPKQAGLRALRRLPHTSPNSPQLCIRRWNWIGRGQPLPQWHHHWQRQHHSKSIGKVTWPNDPNHNPMRKKLATLTAHRELTVSSRWPKRSQPALTEPWPGPWLSCDLAVTEPWSYWRCRELWSLCDWAVTSPSRDHWALEPWPPCSPWAHRDHLFSHGGCHNSAMECQRSAM